MGEFFTKISMVSAVLFVGFSPGFLSARVLSTRPVLYVSHFVPARSVGRLLALAEPFSCS